MRRNMDMQIGALTMSMSHNSMPEQSPGLRHLDPDTDFKVRRIASCINEAIHMSANEPSLGLYRIQEHVHRTAPHLAYKKKDLKANNNRIDETLYDLNLSMDVVDSMRGITNFTRIQEVLKTVIVTKQNLNKIEEEEKARRDREMKSAKIANRSLSCNEPAEGYICPVCYFALSGQEELIAHWQDQHNLDECDNETFHEVELPLDVEGGNDSTVILSQKEHRGISEGEDVLSPSSTYLGEIKNTQADTSSSIEDLFPNHEDEMTAQDVDPTKGGTNSIQVAAGNCDDSLVKDVEVLSPDHCNDEYPEISNRDSEYGCNVEPVAVFSGDHDTNIETVEIDDKGSEKGSDMHVVEGILNEVIDEALLNIQSDVADDLDTRSVEP